MELGQVLQALRNADAAGDTEAAKRLAEIAKQLMAAGEEPAAKKPEPKKESGVLASASKGLESLISSGRTTFGALTGDPNEAARAALQRSQDMERRYADEVGFDRVREAYEKRGLLPAAGEVISQIPKALAEQAPNIASTLASARLGAMAGSAVMPGVGTLVGGLGGAALPGLVQMFGSNVERQAAEQERAGRPISVDVGAAGAAALPQAALDVAGTFIPLGGRLVSKLTGIPAEALFGQTAAQVTKLAEERLAATLLKGGAKGIAAEVPTEVAQQMLERAQAGLPLTSPDALKEYGETAYQVSLLAPIGAAGRLAERGGARGEMALQAEAEQRAAAEEELRAEREAKQAEVRQQALQAEAEAQRKSAATYPAEVAQQYEDLTNQRKTLREQIRKIKKGSDTEFADIEHNKAIGAQLKEVEAKLRETAREYNRVRPALEAQRAQEEAAAAEKAKAEAAEIEQYRQAALRRQAEMTPGFQAEIPGLAPIDAKALPPTTPVPDVQQTAASEFAEKQRELEQLLVAQQQEESDAAEKGDINALKKLRQRRVLLQNEYDFVTKQLQALGGAPTNDVDALQKQIADATAKLQGMAGPGYDPAKADKLIAKIEDLQAQLKALGVPEGAGRQVPLDMGRPVRSQSSESTEAFNTRTYEPGGYQNVERGDGDQMGLFDEQTRDIDVERRQGESDAELARIEKQARMDTTRTEQGTLFGEESKSGIQTGIGSFKTRADLVNDLRIARAARNVMPSSRRAGSTEAVRRALEALRDYDAEAAAEAERGTSKLGEIDEDTQKVLAGAAVPGREAAVQSARALRDGAFADIVDLISRYNQGKAKAGELVNAQNKLIEFMTREAEFRRGAALSDEDKRVIGNDAMELVRELVSRFGDTRNLVSVGTNNDPRFVNAQRDSGEFRTDVGGEGTGPTGMGLINVESRAPGRQTFGSPYAAAKSIQEGLDQIINRFGSNRVGTVESKSTPKEVSPEMLRTQIERAKQSPNRQARMVAERIEEELDAISSRKDLVQDVSQFLSRATTGNVAPELLNEINAQLDQLEKGKRSETEQQADGTIKTAVQGDLFPDVQFQGTVFNTPEQFAQFMSSDALQTLRQLKGIPGETAQRIMARLEPLQKQIAVYEQQIAALRQKYDATKAQRGEAEKLGEEAQAALPKLVALRTQMLSRFEKQVAKAEADYVKASLKHNFSSKVLDELTVAIKKNYEKFNSPLDGLEKRYLKEIADAEREFKLARDRVMIGLPQKIMWMREAKFTPKQIQNELGLNKQSLALLEELAAQPEFKRGILKERQKSWMSDARVIAALDEHLKLSMQLQTEQRSIAQLKSRLNKASLALQEARTALDNDPRLKARLARQQELVQKATGDVEAARQLLGETDATVKAITAQISALGRQQDRLSRIVKGTEQQIAKRADERRTKDVSAETISQREARDAEERKAEQAKLEKEADDPNRKLVSFEPKRKQEEKRIRNAEQIRQLQEKVEMGTAEEKAAAQAELDAFREKLEKQEVGAAKKLQGALNTQAKLIKQIQKNDADLADESISKAKRKELEARRDSLNTQLTAVGARINAKLGSVKEDIPTRADKKAERDAQYAENVQEQLAAIDAGETSGRLAARQVGPVVKKDRLAGNMRTGSLETADERKLSPRNAIQQSGEKTAAPEPKKPPRTKAGKLKQAMLRDSELNSLRDKVEDALDKAREAKDKEQVARRKEQLARLDSAIDANTKTIEELRGEKAKEVPTIEDISPAGPSAYALDRVRYEGSSWMNHPDETTGSVLYDVLSEVGDKAPGPNNLSSAIARVRQTYKDDIALFKSNPSAAAPIEAKLAVLNTLRIENFLVAKATRPEKVIITRRVERVVLLPTKPAAPVGPEALAARFKTAIAADAPFNGMTFAEAARYGAKRTTSPMVRQLFDRLAEVFDAAPEQFAGKVYATTGPSTIEGRLAAGLYAGSTNEILVVAPGVRSGQSNKTLLHELTHAATVYALNMSPELNAQVEALRLKVVDWLETPAGRAYFRKHSMGLGKNRQSIYGLKNTKEFLSELFSDREFQKMLTQIPSNKPRKSIFTRFVEALAKFFDAPGEAGQSLFAEAVALTDDIFNFTVREVYNTPSLQQVAAGDYDVQPLLLPERGQVNPALKSALAVSDSLVAKDKPVAQRVFEENSGLAFATRYVDRFAGFERLSKVMPALQGQQMLYFLRMYDQRMNFVSQSASNGALQLVKKTRKDGEYEYVIESVDGPSLRSTVQILKEAKPLVGNVDDVNGLFTTYLAAKRAERVGFNKLSFGRGLTEAKLKQAVKDIESVPGLTSVFERARNEYNKYNEGLVRFAQQSGALSKETADALLASKDYIPYYRQTKDGGVDLVIGGEAPIRVGSVKDQPYLSELVGGEEPIFDFFKSSVQNTNLLTDMALRNLATKNAVTELVDLKAATFTPSQISGRDVVQFKIDGKDMYARIDTDAFGVDAEVLVKGMEGIPLQLTGALRVAALPARFLRKAITLNPMYVLRQLFRDSVAAAVMSGADFAPVYGALREIGRDSGKTLERRGITGGQMFTGTQEDISLIMRELTEGSTGFTSALAKLEAFGMQADSLTRRAQYNSYIKQGLSEMEATLAALESMNFNKRGASPSIHAINSLIPFVNAQIQGLNALYRTLTGKATAAEKLRVRTKMLTRGAMIVAATLYYAASMQDDEAYQNATPDQKYGNWFIRVPGLDEPVRLPIPFEVGYIFKALPEALYNAIVNGEAGREDAKDAMLAIMRNIIPGGASYGIPQIAKPAIELALGKSFYTGRDILSVKEQGMMPEQQFRDNTSEIAKALGGTFGVSPIKMEALVNGYTGALGIAFMQALNPLFGRGDSPEKAMRRLSDMPVVGTAFQPNDAGHIINRTYEAMKDVEQVKNTVTELLKKGERAKALEVLQKNSNEYAVASAADWFSAQMTKITQYETAVRASDKSPEEKRRLLDEARQAKIKLAAYVRQAAGRTAPQ